MVPIQETPALNHHHALTVYVEGGNPGGDSVVAEGLGFHGASGVWHRKRGRQFREV